MWSWWIAIVGWGEIGLLCCRIVEYRKFQSLVCLMMREQMFALWCWQMGCWVEQRGGM